MADKMGLSDEVEWCIACGWYGHWVEIRYVYADGSKRMKE